MKSPIPTTTLKPIARISTKSTISIIVPNPRHAEKLCTIPIPLDMTIVEYTPIPIRIMLDKIYKLIAIFVIPKFDVGSANSSFP